MPSSRRAAGIKGASIAVVLCVLLAPVMTRVAGGATDNSSNSSLVRVGTAPQIAQEFARIGRVGSTDDIPLVIELRPSNEEALAGVVTSSSTTRRSDGQRYLSPSEFRSRFGPSTGVVQTVRSALQHEGFRIGSLSSNGFELHVEASARTVEAVFDTSLVRYRGTSGSTGFANTRAPAVPGAIANDISAIVGLDTLSRMSRLAVRGSTATSATENAHREIARTGAPSPTSGCSSAIASSSGSNAAYSINQVASAYGFDDLYNAADLGSGATVALIEFAPFVSSDVSSFEQCFSTPPNPTINVQTIDGGPTSSSSSGPGIDVSGEEEAELDIETVVGLAPDATLDVYEAPAAATDTETLDAFTAAIDNPSVKVISTSWGECEADVDSSLSSAEAMLFEQAAVEGKTIVAAAGDEGSEDCYGTLRGQAGDAQAVDDPASQPYVTGVGGTDLVLGATTSETVWNGGDGAGLSGGSGGGGVSNLWQMPSYQSEAAPGLGVVSSTSGCPSGSADCREVPDVSADAGALVAFYCTETGREGCASSGWTGFGGTSLAAPTWASLIALADESTACAGSPLGFVNPALYAVAGGSEYADALRDITVGNNDLLGIHSGGYAASSGYDMASGLGTPIAGSGSGTDDGLVTQLCESARASSFPAAVSATTTTTVASTTSTTSTTTPGSFGSASATATPSITKLSVNAGPRSGGTKIVIRGTSFRSIVSVQFGSRSVRRFSLASATRIIAVSPKGTGPVYITVTSSVSGKSTRTPAAKFVYLAAQSVHSLAPASGPAGTSVRVSGSNFSRVESVKFGSKNAASFKGKSTGLIIAVTPKETGSVHVTVTTPGGTTGTSSASAFRYH